MVHQVLRETHFLKAHKLASDHEHNFKHSVREGNVGITLMHPLAFGDTETQL